MIDKKKIEELIEDSLELHVNDEKAREQYRENLLEALGDDKKEVISFLESCDDDILYEIDTIYEELVEKFGEDIEDIFCDS